MESFWALENLTSETMDTLGIEEIKLLSKQKCRWICLVCSSFSELKNNKKCSICGKKTLELVDTRINRVLGDIRKNYVRNLMKSEIQKNWKETLEEWNKFLAENGVNYVKQ